MAVDTRFFVDVFKDLCERVRVIYDPQILPDVPKRPFCDHDHPINMARKLNEKNDSGVLVYDKYPMIGLLEDFIEDHGNGGDQYFYDLNFTIIIVDETKQEYDSDERYEINIKPILQVIYELFLEAMEESPFIYSVSIEDIKHQKINRTNWGKEGVYGNDGIIFNDLLDAIQLNFTKVKINFNDCGGVIDDI